ncbi:LOW QUALITY PROTEIN: ciliogenesis and planar polarity effector 2 [Myiozetetes cayanensis]|uniref:LOW QUALITY PROTEIN: ciliogenesis and planar polarity effector 2 n=1 Tax=Myiozetetes cayanensis TaxID=478635 RepID=UPI00215F44CD|nr:LOW QUALITY PROTEIN: ciliogenesis and planar polarity effector 2 [Myiozetetes cayanensis]
MAERDSQDPQDYSQDSQLERGWLLSPPGRPYLESLLHKNRRRVFGLLERPVLPPPLAVPTLPYKLFLVGRSGVGKTALVAALAGTPRTPQTPAHHETLGIEATTVFWPAKPRGSARPVLFQLHFWDCGDGALRRFEHLLPACQEALDAVLVLFSFTDRASFEELPAQLSRLTGPGGTGLVRVVVGTKSDLTPHAAVTEGDVRAFEGSWGLQVLRAGGAGGGRGRAGLARAAPILDSLVEQLWKRDQIAAGIARGKEGTPPS